MIKKISELQELVKHKRRKTVVLTCAQDKHALQALVEAVEKNLVDALLVGDESKIKTIAQQGGFSLDKFKIYNICSATKAVEHSIALIKEGHADILMKGSLTTAQLVSGVLHKEKGLRNGSVLSHLALFEIPTYHKIIALSDAAINIAPTMKDKVAILNNAVNFMHSYGVARPKVAMISAVETVSPAMQSTQDAAIISKMADRKQIPNCLVDGPLSFDIAMSKEVADYKGCVSSVAGDPDLLVFPNIESGNVVYKCFEQMLDPQMACIILGAKVPIVLTSRADTQQTKLNSIMLAAATE